MMLLKMRHTFIRPGHPQSNRKLERFHRTLKTEEVRKSTYFDYKDARGRLAEWIGYYNELRLGQSYFTAEIYFSHENTKSTLFSSRAAVRDLRTAGLRGMPVLPRSRKARYSFSPAV